MAVLLASPIGLLPFDVGILQAQVLPARAIIVRGVIPPHFATVCHRVRACAGSFLPVCLLGAAAHLRLDSFSREAGLL